MSDRDMFGTENVPPDSRETLLGRTEQRGGGHVMCGEFTHDL